jgi:hypothetical protein
LTEGGEVAYGVFGGGPPVVLVHGTPSRSYLWRGVVGRLAESHEVYVYDLVGFGELERYEGQDVSIAAQGRVLAELVEAWDLEEPAVAGHDIGGGIVLRAHLLEGFLFGRSRSSMRWSSRRGGRRRSGTSRSTSAPTGRCRRGSSRPTSPRA